METRFIRTCRDGWMSTTLSMLMLLIAALALASMAVPAQASAPMIDSNIITFRHGALEDPAGSLTDDKQVVLFDEIQTRFSHVGYTRDGALRLQLSNALSLDAARRRSIACACCWLYLGSGVCRAFESWEPWHKFCVGPLCLGLRQLVASSTD
jgi:hypothetical protein